MMRMTEEDTQDGGSVPVYGYTGNLGDKQKLVQLFLVSPIQISADMSDSVKQKRPIQ
jgi:hypothetical protein